MKFLISSFIVLLAIGAAYSDDTSNQFVDQIIKSIVTRQSFDPLHIKDHRDQFDKKIGLIEVKGELDLRQMVITGLSHISRNGDAKLDSDNGFVAKMRLGDNEIKVTGELTIKLGKLIHPNLRLEVEIGHLDVIFAVAVGSDGKFSLKEFSIDELQNVHVKVHGLSILDPVIDIVAESFIKFFNTQAMKLISDEIRPMIEAEIKNLKPN